jgi:hypothetical protein
MNGHVFVAHGDLTQVQADVLVYTTDWYLHPGMLRQAFRARFPAFDEWFAALPLTRRPPHSVGSIFWYDPPGEKPRILAVVVTDDGLDPPGQTRAAIRGAVTAAITRLADDVDLLEGRQPLVALPAVNLGYGADPRAQNELAGVQLDEAHRVLQETGAACDVAFITYTPVLHRIFLEARRRRGGGVCTAVPEPPPSLVEALAAGECVLFAGAGLSVPAGLPSWGELIDLLAGELNLKREPNDYLHVAQEYRNQPGGTGKLADLIRSRFQVRLPTLAHYLLLALPMRSIVTTNYDRLLEDTLAALKHTPVRVVEERDVARTGSAHGVYVVKFHGDVERPEEVVLSLSDYDRFSLRRPALATLLRALLLNQKFFFVGYILGDKNLQEIYGEVAAMLGGAQQPAYATWFGRGDRPAWPPATAPLELLRIPGPTKHSQARNFLLWLDRLAERVLGAEAPPFLAPDAESSLALTVFRDRLLAVGTELERACRSPAEADVSVLAGLMYYLAGHGWRPKRRSLSDLWQALSGSASKTARQHYLAAALRSAETDQQRERILAMLGEEARAPETAVR